MKSKIVRAGVMKHIRGAAIALAAALATLPLAAEHPTKERGFRADSLYQFTELDTINLFNGSVNIMLPVGHAYPVTSNLSYAFVLRYAGNVWTESEVCSGKEGENCKIHYKPRKDNAGFGWNLSLGELEHSPLLAYRSPDGAEHVFFDTLHPGEAATSGTRYTRDGSYLRMKDEGTNVKIVEFPDGTKHRYQWDALTSTWLLRYIYNVHSQLLGGLPITSYVKITQIPAAGGGEWHERWDIEDSAGRSHKVYFRSPAPTANSPAVVDRIELKAFDGVTAVYDLGYNNAAADAGGTLIDNPATTVPRPCRYANDSAAIQAHMLTTFRLSKGNPSSSSEPFTSFVMSYEPGPANCTGTPLATGGLLRDMRLPTGGKYAWTYSAYNFAGDIPYDQSVGISQRIAYDSSGNVVQYRRYEATHSTGYGTNVVRTIKVPGDSTTLPAGNVDSKVVSYFQTSGPSPSLGLPYTTTESAGGRYLSSVTYDCNESSAGEACNASPERRQYILYDMDPVDSSCGGLYPCMDRNRRVQAERTVYTSDGDRYTDTARESATFDGLGHYRKITMSGTFGSGNDRVEWTNYDASPGNYPGSFTLPSTWLLERYDQKTAVEGSVHEGAQFCFDSTTGRLLRARRLADTSPNGIGQLTAGDHDVVVVNAYDGDGNLTGEQFFGGEGQTVGTGALCSLTLRQRRIPDCAYLCLRHASVQ